MSDSSLVKEFGNAFVGKAALVTGVTGFVGWHLAEALVSLGAKVYGLSRTAEDDKVPPGVQPIRLDLLDMEQLVEFLSSTRPQLVFHLASQVTGDQDVSLARPMVENTFLSSINLFMALQQVGCERLVHTGSGEEYGRNPVPNQEEQKEDPTSPYAAAKTCSVTFAKLFAELYRVPIVILRPFLIYGPHQAPSKLIPYAILSVLANKPPTISTGTQKRDPVYVMDVVRGYLKAALSEKAVGGIFNLGTGRGFSVREIVEKIIAVMGSDLQPHFTGDGTRALEGDRIADIGRAQKVLDWQPRWSLEQGLQQTIKWYKARFPGVST